MSDFADDYILVTDESVWRSLCMYGSGGLFTIPGHTSMSSFAMGIAICGQLCATAKGFPGLLSYPTYTFFGILAVAAS